jgi:hypothetical protein
VVQRYGGTVDKFTGDGIMAVFGAPAALEYNALRACLAALSIQDEAKRLAADVDRRDGVTLRLRVGINSGDVIAGEIGSGSLGYTAIGEQVGIAQRMESVAPSGAVMLPTRRHVPPMWVGSRWRQWQTPNTLRHDGGAMTGVEGSPRKSWSTDSAVRSNFCGLNSGGPPLRGQQIWRPWKSCGRGAPTGRHQPASLSETDGLGRARWMPRPISPLPRWSCRS